MSEATPDLPALKRGDEQAWTQAFHSLWRFAYRAALSPQAGLTPDEAEDVAVEALAKLAPRIAAVASLDELQALLVTIAQRQAISLARRKSALKRPEIAVHLDTLPPMEAEGILNSESPDNPLGETEAAELLGLLRHALNDVDATTRQLLLDHVIEGFTIRELSQRHALPPGTVSVKLARGLRRVRQSLQQSPQLLKELQAHLR